jgi:hypothetical protein
MNCGTSNRRYVVRKSSTKKTAVKKVVRQPRYQFPVGVPVNVKVAGERAMRKQVVLVPLDKDTVRVFTGSRGRPAHLPVQSIERVRAL